MAQARKSFPLNLRPVPFITKDTKTAALARKQLHPVQTVALSFISARGGTNVNSTDALSRKRCRRDLFDPSILQAQNPMTAAREVKIVSSDQRGQLVIVMHFRDQLEDGIGGALVEVSGRLIG